MGIYDNIRIVAKNKGISINKLEQELGMTRGSMYKFNQSTPGSEKIQKIADYLGCSVEMLMKGEESEGYYFDKQTLQLAQRLYQDKNLHMLFDAAKDATPSELKSFYDMIQIMKKRERGDES